MIRIIIAGGRDFNNYDLLKESVYDILTTLSVKNLFEGLGAHPARESHTVEFISGNAKGADTLGEKFVFENGWKLSRFPADWDQYGKRAGYLRNDQMAKFAVSDKSYGVLIAFWDGKSRGTKHMIDLAEKHGLEVFIINY